MLVRKSLYGNARPNPGDLYDPRDGSCLPNFHLSTTHDPNLETIEQDLVKYDIQLVKELPASSGSLRSSKQSLSAHNPWVESHSLMLLAVAEYAESQVKPPSEPFVIQKVFYREAVAGVLHLRHRVGDKDIQMLQNNLRHCLPDPASLAGHILEQFNMAISKVSIIQHGQEYHYTNIRMAFTEISKIINQVCSPTNLNARSVLVNLPPGASYAILDRNKYLAYLHEKEKIKREEERQRQHREKQRQHQEKLRRLNEVVYLKQHQLEMEKYQMEERMRQQIDASSHMSYSPQLDFSSEPGNHQSMHYYGQNSDPQQQQPGFALETSIITRDGKKIIVFHDTGETMPYDDYIAQQNEYAQNSLRRQKAAESAVGGNKSSKPDFTKSTPNLADEEIYQGENYHHHQGRRMSRDDDLRSSRTQFQLDSYLKSKSKSVGDLRDCDKIDIYPALLIKPGRKQVRQIFPLEEDHDKWRKKSPQFWNEKPKSPKLEKKTNPSAIATVGPNTTRPTVTITHHNNQIIKAPNPQGPQNQNILQNASQPAKGEDVFKKPAVPPKYTKPPSFSSTSDRVRRLSGDSTVSTFSDISVSSQLQQNADTGFNRIYRNAIAASRSQANYDRSQDFGESDSSMLYEATPSATPEPVGSDTLDREFVYKAYPIKIKEIR